MSFGIPYGDEVQCSRACARSACLSFDALVTKLKTSPYPVLTAGVLFCWGLREASSFSRRFRGKASRAERPFAELAATPDKTRHRSNTERGDNGHRRFSAAPFAHSADQSSRRCSSPCAHESAETLMMTLVGSVGQISRAAISTGDTITCAGK